MRLPRWLFVVLLIGLVVNWGWGETIPAGQQPEGGGESPVEAEPVASLAYQGKTLQQWIAQLADEEPYRRAAAIEALQALGEPAIPALIVVLSYHPEAAIEALQALGEPAIPALITALSYRPEAAPEALQALGEPAIPALIAALQYESIPIRRRTAEVLGKIGVVTPDVMAALTKALRDEDQQVCENAAESLVKILVEPEEPLAEARPRGEELRQLWILPEERQLANLPRFGEELFAKAGIEVGKPPANMPVPPGYLLGAGDELAIRCWGEGIEHLNSTATVSAEGNIYVPLLGEIFVADESLGTARSLLTQKLREFYANSQVSVTVATTRLVTIYVTGDVRRPGRYELDGTATVLTALYAAGGPSTSGSLRNIRWIRRGQEPVHIDLYPYLLTGAPLSDQPLRPGDTIFAGSIGPEIGITGQVQRPARYEVTESIACAEAIALAGGLAPVAYAQNLQVWRVAEHQRQAVINVNLQLDLSSGEMVGADFRLQGGDVVVVPAVLPIPENAVRISGAVRRPGIYEVEEGMRLSDVIRVAAQGLDEGAYLERGEIKRLDAHKQPQHIGFSVKEALKQTEEVDIVVKPYDDIRIYYREEITPLTYVEVRGPVQNPDQYQWVEQMTVRDLIDQAGGVTDEAYLLQARLLRLQPDGNRRVLKVRLVEALAGDIDANLVLAAGDILEIPTQEAAVSPRQVHIDGFVQRPDSYQYYAEMKISDLVFAAGGLMPGAAHKIQYTRGRQPGTPKIQEIELNWEQEDQVTVVPDLLLKPDDQVTVLGVGDFRQQAEVVEVNGQMTTPGAYILRTSTEETETVYDLLQRAGPLLADANVDGIIVYRPTEKAMTLSQQQNLQQIMRMYNRETAGPVVAEKEAWQRTVLGEQTIVQAAEIFTQEGAATVAFPPRVLSLANWITGIPIEGQRLLDTQGQEGDIPLRGGDTIVVPPRKHTVAVLGSVVRPGTVLYQPQAKLADYIRKAGGLTDDAAQQRTVVIRANSATYLASDIREIRAGDIILIPSDYLLRTIRTQTGFERVLRALGPIVGALLLAG